MNEIKIRPLGEILELDIKKEYLIEDLIYKGNIVLLVGQPFSGKSLFTQLLASSFANKSDLLGKRVFYSGNTLIIDKENNDLTIKTRYESLAHVNDTRIFYGKWAGPLNESLTERLIEVIKEKNINYLVLDSLVRFTDGDENDSRASSRFFEMVFTLREHLDLVMIIHHTNKTSEVEKIKSNTSIRGSSDIAAAVDSILIIESTKEPTVKKLYITKERLGPIPIEPIMISLQTKDGEIYATRRDDISPDSNIDKQNITVRAVEDFLSDKDSAQLFVAIKAFVKSRNGYSENPLRKLINKMKDDGKIEILGDQKNGYKYKLASTTKHP